MVILHGYYGYDIVEEALTNLVDEFFSRAPFLIIGDAQKGYGMFQIKIQPTES